MIICSKLLPGPIKRRDGIIDLTMIRAVILFINFLTWTLYDDLLGIKL